MCKTLFIRGNKISLRTFKEDDITERFISWLNDPQVVGYSNQRFHTHTYESCFQYLCSFSNTSNIYLAIVDATTGCLYGSITAYCNTHHGTADIGILLGDRTVWGQGIGYECYNLLMNYLFDCLGLRKITAGTLRKNIGMLKVLEKVGMKLESVRKKHEIVDAEAVDLLYFAKFSQ